MKQVVAAVVVAVLALGVVSAQDYYYGAEPAPSMYAAQAGMPAQQQQPMPPSWGSIMYGGAQANPAFVAGMPPAAAFVEQQQQQLAYAPFPQEMEEEGENEAAELEGAAEEAEAANEAQEEGEDSVEESEQETESSGEDSGDARFQQVQESKPKHQSHKKKKGGKGGKKKKSGMRKAKKFLQRLAGGGKKKKSKRGAKVRMNGKKKRRGSNSWFKPSVGKKKKNLKRTPDTPTPKAAGGKGLPPMPAPLPQKPKINCKKSPHLCIEAETPASGEEPGDHSPKAVFKKKMEVIKKSLMVNNRNIAQESKWIDQVDAIMKQYNVKIKKVKEHIADERKAIKELLRQRRIVLNEKKQKELEMKLKIATTELNALTDALTQVQKKERELGAGKSTLGSKIKLLAEDLKKLRTKHAADKAQSIVKL